jgi:glycosyltransferase involved in cell wall biosynthesis
MHEQPAVLAKQANGAPLPKASPRAPSPAVVDPLRIALLGYRSNPYSGGQGVYLRNLSTALADLGHSVDVISGEPYPVLDPRVRLIELPGLNLFAHPNHVRALRLRHFRSATDLIEYFSMLTGGFSEPYTFGRRLVRYLRRERPHYDVIHDNQSLCYGLLGASALGYPLLATIHHPITHDRDIALANASDWGHRLLIRRWHSFLRMQAKVARRLPMVVTVSECSKHDLQQAFAIFVVGVSSGVRVWELERYITPMQPDAVEGLVLTTERWILEVYRTIIGTREDCSYMFDFPIMPRSKSISP